MHNTEYDAEMPQSLNILAQKKNFIMKGNDEIASIYFIVVISAMCTVPSAISKNCIHTTAQNMNLRLSKEPHSIKWKLVSEYSTTRLYLLTMLSCLKANISGLPLMGF